MVDLNTPRPDKITSVTDDTPGAVTLADQLEKQSVPYTTTGLPRIVGTGGAATLIHYISPATGKPVTVLCVPLRIEIDCCGERYYYFIGMDRESSRRHDWIQIYESCKDL